MPPKRKIDENGGEGSAVAKTVNRAFKNGSIFRIKMKDFMYAFFLTKILILLLCICFPKFVLRSIFIIFNVPYILG